MSSISRGLCSIKPLPYSCSYFVSFTVNSAVLNFPAERNFVMKRKASRGLVPAEFSAGFPTRLSIDTSKYCAILYTWSRVKRFFSLRFNALLTLACVIPAISASFCCVILFFTRSIRIFSSSNWKFNSDIFIFLFDILFLIWHEN